MNQPKPKEPTKETKPTNNPGSLDIMKTAFEKAKKK